MRRNGNARTAMLKEELARWEAEVARLRIALDNAEARLAYYQSQTAIGGCSEIWTPEQDEILLALKAKRTPYDAIALHMGRSYSAVASRWWYLTREPSYLEAAE